MDRIEEADAMRVLQAAASLDAVVKRAGPPGPPAPVAAPGSASSDQPISEEYVWIDMPETEQAGERRGDLDSWLDVFRATATSVRHAWRHVEALTFESVAFGWLALARKHEPLPVVPPTAGREAQDTAVLRRWLEHARWAQAVYGAASEAELAAELDIQPDDLLVHVPASTPTCPAYFAALHRPSRCVRLVVRGTGHLQDLLTNLAGHSSPMADGHAHAGMLRAARQLLAAEGARLRGALTAHPGWGLHIIGHSLGGGVAALLAILAASDSAVAAQLGLPPPTAAAAGPAAAPSDPDGGLTAEPLAVHATCFGLPPVVTSGLAERSIPYVESIVYNADLVSRCSVLSLRRLATELGAASEEVQARSELAQALQRSGALGLANRMVAVALCRATGGAAQEPPGPTGLPPPAPGRSAVAEGLTLLGGALRRVAANALAPPGNVQGGKTGQLAALGSQLAAAAGAAVKAAYSEIHHAAETAESSSRAADAGSAPDSGPAFSSIVPSASSRPVNATGISGSSPSLSRAGSQSVATGGVPGPPAHSVSGPSSPGPTTGGALPPLVGPGSASSTASGGSSEPPLRRAATDAQDVLSPPPLVAAAAAAASAETSRSAAAAAAAPPLAKRNGLLDLVGDFWSLYDTGGAKTALAAATASAASAAAAVLLPYGGTAGAAAAGTTPTASGGVVLMPLPAPPVPLLPAPATSAAAGAAAHSAPLPTLPPVSLPPVAGSSTGAGSSVPPLRSRPQGLASVKSLGARSLKAGSASGDAADGGGPNSHGSTEGDGATWAADEAAFEYHELVLPGRVWVIERRGADATATFRLLRDVGRPDSGSGPAAGQSAGPGAGTTGAAPASGAGAGAGTGAGAGGGGSAVGDVGRLLLKRSMLRDHLLSHYVGAMERMLGGGEGGAGEAGASTAGAS